MRTCSSLRVVLCVLAVVWLGGSVAVAASYEQTVATAKAFAAEKSWAKAQEAYAAALAVAPDAEAKRWCELGRVDAGWREAGNNAGNEALLARIAEFENLLERYQKPGTEKDEFWFAAMESWADFRAARELGSFRASRLLEEVDYQNQLNRSRGTGVPERRVSRFLDLSTPPDADRLTICEALGEQRPTAEARGRYLESVRALVADPGRQWNRTLMDRLIGQVRTASRLAEKADDRAWFALVAQLLTAPQADTNVAKAAQWREVLAAAKGTRWETLAAGAEFCWRAASGWGPDQAVGAPVDLVVRVRECDALLGRIWPELHLDRSPEEIDWADNEKGIEAIHGAAEGWMYPVVLALGQWRSQWREPKVELSLPKRVLPGAALTGYFGATAVDSVDFALVRLTPEEWFVSTWSRLPEAKSRVQQGEPLRRWNVAVGAAERLGYRSGGIEVDAASLTPGFYKLVAEGRTIDRTVRSTHCFLVSRAEVALLNVLGSPAALHCLDAETRQPIRMADVTGVVGDCTELGTSSLSGATDALGHAELSFGAINGSYRERLFGYVGGQPFDIEWRGSPLFVREQPAEGDVILDREVYRPGETVRWKLVLRDQADGRFAIPPAGTKLRVSVEVGDTMLLKDREYALNAFGTIAGEVALPETLAPGYGNLRFSFAGDAKRRITTASSAAGFRVEFYCPPASKAVVELAGAPETLRPGREAAFRVMASYLSGGPVSGATVRGQLTFHRSYFDEDDPRHAAKLRRAEATLPKPRECVATTDESGAAVFRCTLPEDLMEGTKVALKGTVLPSGAAEAKFDRTFHVTRTGYLYAPFQEGRTEAALLGSNVMFGAVIRSGDMRAVAFSGTAQIVECRWNEVWRLPSGRIVSGVDAAGLGLRWKKDDSDFESEAATADRPECLNAGYEESVVAQIPARGDAQGKVEVRYKPLHAGLYRLRLMRDGTELFTPESSRSMTIVCDESTTELALPRAETTVATLGPVVNGAPQRVLVALPKKNVRGWLLVAGADRAVVQPFELKESVGILTVDNPPRFEGRGSVRVQRNGEEYAGGSAVFDAAEAETKLRVSIEPGAAQSRPGDAAQLRLGVRCAREAMQPAELCVGVVDEAAAALGRGPDWRLQPAFAVREPVSAALSLAERRSTKADEPKDGRCGIAAAELWAGARNRQWYFMENLAELARLGPYAWDETFGAASLPEPLMFCSLDKAPSSAPSLRLRTRFDATAFWAPQVVTDAKGEATVRFQYPDNLTQWRIEAYAVGADGNSFGTATAFTRTSLPFQARLNLPRFLVAGDSAVPSATLVNRTETVLTANAELAVAGAVVPTEADRLGRSRLAVSAQGEAPVEWPVRAGRAGTAEFTLKAWAGAESDGMKLSLPVLENGILQETAASGQLARGEKQRELVLALPEPLDPARTTARVQLTGSRAAAMLDALPYLVDYPYGCVEQTLSRFLPAVVVKRTLGELGFDAASVETRILGKETEADAARRVKTAGLGRLDEVVAKSLARLDEAQRLDGGFGWWPGAAEGDLWMTAYAAWGLNLARGAGVDVPPQMLERANTALTTALSDRKMDWSTAAGADARAWALAAVAEVNLDERGAKRRAEAWAQAYAGRDALTASGRACLALAAAKLGAAEERVVLLRNLENGLVRDVAAGPDAMVHWGSTSGYWRAREGAVEATALTLLALLELDPQHALVEPAMSWLVLNRKSGNWESTRATALAVLALSRCVRVRGEALGETEVEVLANGVAVGRVKLNRETLLSGATTVELPVAKLRAGGNRVVLRRVAGDGPAYAVALAKSWAAGETVQPAGHLAQVARGFVRQKATPTLVGTLRIEPETLSNGGSAKTGEEVHAVVTVTVASDLEYVMIEVPKPAGCEPLNPLSGWDARMRRVAGGGQMTEDGAGRPIYREERDEKSVFFLDHLEAGTWELRFGMRAVTAGDFRALPVQVEAMYVPEIRANSDAPRLRIERR